MSETDSFIQEVTEEVRQDQMFALWKKWGPFIITGVVLLVAAAAGWSYMQSQERAAAESRGAAFLASDPETAADQIALPDRIDGPALLIAEMSAAAALARDGKTSEAAERYAVIAERTGVEPEYGDLARLHAIRLGAAGFDAAALDALADGAGPYRLLAREMRAMRRLAAGETAAAHAELNEILNDPESTDGLRQRAAAMILASGGEVTVPRADGGS